MYRTSEKKIQEWLDKSSKALLIFGARQVGKTYLVRETLKKNNVPFLEVNFIERQDILNNLKTVEDAGEIVRKLELYSDVELQPGKSVIFLDEIQKYPEIITKIKFLVDNGKYRYVLSGSNLGVELYGIKSVPVGYMESFAMYPMDFFEFAVAIGMRRDNVDYVKECMEKCTPIDDVIHKKLIETFYYYLVVGGMPAVVNVFNATHNLENIYAEQRNIIDQYKADFVKYEDANKKLKIISIYDNIPAQLKKQNHKFSYTLLNKELKFSRYEESFLWLKDAAVSIPVYNVDEPKSPLEISKQTNAFKLYLSDVGLLTSCFPATVRRELLEMNPDNTLNNGALFENFVAEELQGCNALPYYFKNSSIGEIDFITELTDETVPIEVKSGNDYKKHASLNNLLKSYSFDRAYVLSVNNIECENGIIYLPIYMAGLLQNRESLNEQMKNIW